MKNSHSEVNPQSVAKCKFFLTSLPPQPTLYNNHPYPSLIKQGHCPPSRGGVKGGVSAVMICHHSKSLNGTRHYVLPVPVEFDHPWLKSTKTLSTHCQSTTFIILVSD